jgi:hypothetical protein
MHHWEHLETFHIFAIRHLPLGSEDPKKTLPVHKGSVTILINQYFEAPFASTDPNRFSHVAIHDRISIGFLM